MARGSRGWIPIWNWRPTEWLSIVNSAYAGSEVQGDPDSLRVYSDNNLQVRYYKGAASSLLRSLSLSLVGDLGYEHRGNAPSGWMGGFALSNRFDFGPRWKATVRGDFIRDETQAITPKFPVGAAYPWPGKGPLSAGGLTATVDFWPSPWLVTRLEYAHRAANQPFFAGPDGITGPDGLLPTSPAAAATFTPDLRTFDDRLMLNVTLRL